jgi:hypothetical protein
MRSVRSVAVLSCIALLLLAGCSALPETGGADPYTEAGEPLNATALQEDHRSNVRAADSFTVVTESASTSGNASTESRTVAAVDLDADRVRQDASYERGIAAQGTERTSVSNTTVYQSEETIYVRTVNSVGNRSTTEYQTLNRSRREGRSADGGSNLSAQFAGLDRQINVVRGANWTQRGTETNDGTTVTRYTANGSDAFDPERLGGSGGTPDVTAFNATLLVTSDGTIRSLTYDIEVEMGDRRVAVDSRVTVESIGETSVEEPGWLGEARNASGEQTAR